MQASSAGFPNMDALLEVAATTLELSERVCGGGGPPRTGQCTTWLRGSTTGLRLNATDKRPGRWASQMMAMIRDRLQLLVEKRATQMFLQHGTSRTQSLEAHPQSTT